MTIPGKVYKSSAAVELHPLHPPLYHHHPESQKNGHEMPTFIRIFTMLHNSALSFSLARDGRWEGEW